MDETTHIAARIEAAELARLLKTLQSSKAPAALHALTDTWHTRIGQFQDENIARYRIDLACRAGCSWCCRSLRVDVTAPEAFRIKSWLDTHRDATQLTALQNQARNNATRAQHLSPTQYSIARITCMFLIDNQCSIYEVRPATCRTYHSLDVDACERKYIMPAMRQGALAVRGLLLGAQAFLNAMLGALRKQRMDSNTYELAHSMHTLFTVSNAFALWRQGKKPFGTPPPIDPPVADTPLPGTASND